MLSRRLCDEQQGIKKYKYQ